MAKVSHSIVLRIANLCRSVAVALIAGVCRWYSIDAVNDWVKSRTLIQQFLITFFVLLLLFGFSVFSAYFGWVGLLVFWLLVVLVVN